MDKNINGLEINKPANVTDAYDGGLKVIRDARNTSGGTPWHVSTKPVTPTKSIWDLFKR